MNALIITALIVVTLALISYSVAVITEQKKSIVTKWILFFLTAGVTLDISSTALMIAGSTNIPLTFHGIIGYTALLLMLIDAVLIWKHWARGAGTTIPRGLHMYTRIAYSWWVIVYIIGAIISTLST